MLHNTPISLASALRVACLGLVLSCDDESSRNACDQYVAYMCDCHPSDYDCGQLENTYANPDSADLDACRIALEDQEAADAEASDFACGAEATR